MGNASGLWSVRSSTFSKFVNVRSSSDSSASHKQATWRHIRAELVHRTGLARQETNVASDQHSLFLNLKGVARVGQNYLDGKRVAFVERPEGSLVYIPPGCNWSGWDEGDELASYLLISVHQDLVGGLFESHHPIQIIPANLGFKNLNVQFAAQKVVLEMTNNDAASRFMVEAHVVEIFVNLLRRFRTASEVQKGGLSPIVLKRVVDMIEALCDEKLGLKELSEQAGMSLFHFSRAFKQSTGSSPHSYLKRRRLERATDLLQSSDLSVTQIALACGFASSSHLSTAFSRELGVSPNIYRARLAGELRKSSKILKV